MNEIIGTITVLMTIGNYVPYIYGVIRGTIIPHPVSWLIWTLLTGTSFFAQISDNAGPGAWSYGVVLVFNVVIFVFAARQKKVIISRLDWTVMAMGVLAIPLWIITHDPLGAVILVTFACAIAYVPTFIKAFRKPKEDATFMYAINFVRHSLAIVALENYTLVTMLFPAMLVLANGIVATTLFKRKKKQTP